MNSIEILLLDLVRIAESPLYSTYRWLGREIGCDLSMAGFLRLVDHLVTLDVVRLWSIDPDTQERTQHGAVPIGLDERYATVSGLDESFDPFALSLTLGAAAGVVSKPDWEIDFNFNEETFRLRAKSGTEAAAVLEVAKLFPEIELIEQRRSAIEGGRVAVSGSVVVRR